MCDKCENKTRSPQRDVSDERRVSGSASERFPMRPHVESGAGQGTNHSPFARYPGTVVQLALDLSIGGAKASRLCSPNETKSRDEQRALDQLVNTGILKRGTGGWLDVEADALRVYIQALCNVPFPIKQWVMP